MKEFMQKLGFEWNTDFEIWYSPDFGAFTEKEADLLYRRANAI